MTVPASWPAVLDALEARVRAQEAALDGLGPYPESEAFPPEVDGELPPELRLRAIILARRCSVLQARAGRELARRRGRLPGA